MESLRKIQIAKLFQSIYQEDYASLKRLFEVGPKILVFYAVFFYRVNPYFHALWATKHVKMGVC